MNKKHVNTIVALADIIAGGIFVASFFTVDPKKAVKMRWTAVGIAAASITVGIINTKSNTKTT